MGAQQSLVPSLTPLPVPTGPPPVQRRGSLVCDYPNANIQQFINTPEGQQYCIQQGLDRAREEGRDAIIYLNNQTLQTYASTGYSSLLQGSCPISPQFAPVPTTTPSPSSTGPSA